MQPQVDRKYSSSNNLKSGQRAEAGACDLCSLTCSSCLHIDQQMMGSKVDECSGETCTGYTSNVSVDDAAPDDKILKFETEQKSEIRNIDSGNSSNISENVYPEVSLLNSGSLVAFQDAEPKGKECPDVNMSCVTGTEDAKLSDVNVSIGVPTDFPSSAASDGTLTSPGNEKLFSHTSSACEDMKYNVGERQNNHSGQSKNGEEPPELTPVSICSPVNLSLQSSGLPAATEEDAADAICSLNVKDGPSHAPSVKSLDNEEHSCSHFCAVLEVPREHLNSLSTNEVTSDVVHSEMAVDAFQVIDKIGGSSPCPDAKGNSLESHTMDEGEDSDVVEHDVKVCDICGDAGREDLLAICCRCSDGAEHTYCMQEMLVKVPEGDWMCEECKFDVVIENQKQDKVSTADGNEKCNSGHANPEKSSYSMKSEAKGSNDEGTKSSKDPSGGKISAKRHIEDAEVSSAAKKRIVEPNYGSTKTSMSNCGATLSRDSSFKHLDKGRIKPAQHSSTCTVVAHESAESPSGLRLQTSQGALLKSTSFNSLNMKSKVKLVDDVVPQKQRSVREPISLDKKEGASRSMGKSMSFKHTNSGPNSGESKVRMLSSKFPSFQDPKRSRYTKDQSLSERKNSFSAERTSVSSPTSTSSSFTAKNDKKLAPCAEGTLLSSVRNQRDTKPGQSDSKSVALSRSSSFVVRKGSEMPASSGEGKRQSSQLASLVGVPSTNGISSSDTKPKPNSPTEDSSSSSCIAERPPCNGNEGLPDGPCRLKESTSFCERGKESSACRPRQSSASGRIVICQKCNEVGHLAQFCTADRPASPVSDLSASKNSREITEGKDKLRAAIEAAVLRKPGINRKHRVLDQSDDVALSSVSSEIAPQHHVFNSSNRGNATAAEEMSEGWTIPENSCAVSCKQATIDSVKQSGMLQVEASASRTGGASYSIATDGSSLIRNMQGQVPATLSSLLKTLPIPDHEYIWQGHFEIYRTGKMPKFYDGIQAHLSNCVSTKVIQAVNKFSHNVLLNEVPRLNTWPRLFQEYGVKEENIALFFYPKDLLSYEKSYKVLLDNMMKNDLALKANLDDVELMIFPSNQLPEKSQRWNKLFFLWGVFQGRSTGCIEPNSQKQILSQKIPSAFMSLPENMCSLRPVDKDLSECDESASVSDAPASQTPSDHQKQTDTEKQNHKVDSSSVMVVESSIPEARKEVDTSISHQEPQRSSTSLEGGVKPASKLEQVVHTSEGTITRTAGYNKCDQMPKDEDSSLSGRRSWHQLDKSRTDGNGSLGGENVSDKMSTSQCQLDLEYGSMHNSPPSGTINQVVKGNKKRQHVEIGEMTSEAASARSSHVIPGNGAKEKSNEEGHPRKRQKTDVYAIYGGSNETSSPAESPELEFRKATSGFPSRADCESQGFDRTDFHSYEGNTERFFFPVRLHSEEIDINKAAQSIPWRSDSLDDDGVHDKTAPNLELALGAETKPLVQGVPAFLVGKEEKKKTAQEHRSQGGASSKGEDDDESASLSLSLSFPFPGEEQRVRSMPNPQRQHANTWLLFAGSRDN